MDHDERKTLVAAFREAVNMSPKELEHWLDTEESRSVGWVQGGTKSSPDGPESVGHHSGREILAIRRKRAEDLDEHDLEHMRKVVGYVHRHLAQRPEHDIRETRWRYSLMNWGHDPLKDT